MEMKSLIEESLKIPVIELFEPIIPPCATWSHLSDTSGLEGDGAESEGMEGYQIDVSGQKPGDNQNQGKKAERRHPVEHINYNTGYYIHV